MTGLGYDLHRLELGNKLIIAGIEVPSELGPVAHSDGDVAIHAIIDAILGAAGMDDIGEQFPNNDPRYKNIDSGTLLKETITKIHEKGFEIVNIDCTVILEEPKLKNHKHLMRDKIAELVGAEKHQITIKAKTNESIGDIGSGRAIASLAVCELKHK